MTTNKAKLLCLAFLLLSVAARAGPDDVDDVLSQVFGEKISGKHTMPDGTVMSNKEMEISSSLADDCVALWGNCHSTSCCGDDGGVCYQKSDSYSQCRKNCPSGSGWYCDTDAPTSAPTTATPTAAPTATPTEVTATADGETNGVCAADGSSFYYVETVNQNKGLRKIKMNTCPNHPWAAINPNSPFGETKTYKVPAYPKLSSTETTDLSQKGGRTGVLFNGAYVFSAYGGTNYGQVVDYGTTAAYNEGDTFDQCGCHASSDDSPSYHCHVPPSCLLNQLGATELTHSPQIGWSPDGFPIYGPRGADGALLQLCSVSGGTYGTGSCLDDCSGAGSATGGHDSIDDGFTYRYHFLGEYDDGKQCKLPSADHLSAEAYYPMTPICLRGCIESDSEAFSGWGGLTLPTCDGTAVDGYESGFTASASSTLSTNTEACNV